MVCGRRGHSELVGSMSHPALRQSTRGQPLACFLVVFPLSAPARPHPEGQPLRSGPECGRASLGMSVTRGKACRWGLAGGVSPAPGHVTEKLSLRMLGHWEAPWPPGRPQPLWRMGRHLGVRKSTGIPEDGRHPREPVWGFHGGVTFVVCETSTSPRTLARC